MNGRIFAGVAAVALNMILTVTQAFPQTEASAGKPQSLGWTIQQPPPGGTYGGGGGNDGFAACVDDIVKYCTSLTAGAARGCLNEHADKLSAACKAELAAPRNPQPTPPCTHSPICGNRLTPGSGSDSIQRVMWDQTMGYTFSYPYELPPGGGGVSAVDLDSKGNLWAYQRNAVGKPQLLKFDSNHKLIVSVGPDVVTHQYKAHGMKVDKEDNVWICDANGSTVKKVSPEGKLLMTLGVRGKRGDWVEAKGQRLLWQPVHIDFGPNGDIYIFEGHAEESPNDTDSDDPTNNIGAARVIHLDKNGKFINQWYGNSAGPGKFDKTHGSAVDPITGQVWIGDRMQYRIVVYSAEGTFIKTIQMRNTVCAMAFEPNGQLWVGTGQDGQYLKVDRDGNVLGAIGNGRGMGFGQFIDAAYFAIDPQGNLYAPDTSNGRITVMSVPKK